MDADGSQSTKSEESSDSTVRSIEQLCQEFTAYKQQKEEQMRKESLPDYFDLGLTKDMTNLRVEMDKMKTRMNDLLRNDALSVLFNQTKNKTTTPGDAASDGSLSKAMPLTCSFTKCLFEHCKRNVDGHVMLLHCIFDHSDKCGHGKYYELAEGERAELTIDPKSGKMWQNQVLGLLTFSGTIEEKILNIRPDIVYNGFLPDEFEHLESQIPIVVMLCKTKTSALLRDRKLAEHIAQKDDYQDNIYVIWLVSPNVERNLNATLTLSGRNAENTVGATIGLRYMCESQNTKQFMSDAKNFWRLTYKEIQILSNNFEDHLVLQISLTEYK